MSEELHKLQRLRAEIQQRENEATDRVAELELLLAEAERSDSQ